jgi:hypothetical protein
MSAFGSGGTVKDVGFCIIGEIQVDDLVIKTPRVTHQMSSCGVFCGLLVIQQKIEKIKTLTTLLSAMSSTEASKNIENADPMSISDFSLLRNMERKLNSELDDAENEWRYENDVSNFGTCVSRQEAFVKYKKAMTRYDKFIETVYNPATKNYDTDEEENKKNERFINTLIKNDWFCSEKAECFSIIGDKSIRRKKHSTKKPRNMLKIKKTARSRRRLPYSRSNRFKYTNL